MIHCLKPDLLPAKFNSVKLKCRNCMELFIFSVCLSILVCSILQYFSIHLPWLSKAAAPELTLAPSVSYSSTFALKKGVGSIQNATRLCLILCLCKKMYPYTGKVMTHHETIDLITLQHHSDAWWVLLGYVRQSMGSQCKTSFNLMPRNGQVVADQNQWQKLEPSRRLWLWGRIVYCTQICWGFSTCTLCQNWRHIPN